MFHGEIKSQKGLDTFPKPAKIGDRKEHKMPQFQKRHYLKIAESLHTTKGKRKPARLAALAALGLTARQNEMIVEAGKGGSLIPALSDMFAEDNEFFQPARFATACDNGIYARYVRPGVQGGPAMQYVRQNGQTDWNWNHQTQQAAREARQRMFRG
jgi:hypothetical protein